MENKSNTTFNLVSIIIALVLGVIFMDVIASTIAAIGFFKTVFTILGAYFFKHLFQSLVKITITDKSKQ